MAHCGHLLEVRDLRCGYGKKKPVEVVHGIDIHLDEGEFVCIVGANGCGKTTALKALMGLLPTLSGLVLVAGKSIGEMDAKDLAKCFAYIPQAHTPPFPFSVGDVVMMGRTPHINKLSKPTERDRVIAMSAMQLLGVDHLINKAYTELSGGQQQLVLIARALAQESKILVMDEPTAALDFGNQQLVLSRMKTLSRMGKAVIMVTHDPDHALFCADKVVVMEKGLVVAQGTPRECVTTSMLQRIYGTSARVLNVEVEPGRIERVCVPLL